MRPLGFLSVATYALLGIQLSACGTALPIQDFRNPLPIQHRIFVFAIATHIRCELRQAVQEEVEGTSDRKKLNNWAASIALTLRGTDTSRFNPNINAFTPLENFNFFGGARLEAGATREMTMTYFITFKELLADKPFLDGNGNYAKCTSPGRAEPITGNLGIHDTLTAALDIMDSKKTITEALQNGPYDTITHHVTFDLEGEGTVGPSWKFTQVNIGSGTNIFSSSRKQTDELIITMGPTVLGNRKLLAPSRALLDAFGVERIRSAVRSPTNFR